MRRPRPADGLRSTRRSRTFYPVDPALQERMRATSFEAYYIFLLHQDLDFVIPYTIGRRGGPQARVTGPDADRAAPLIERALSGRDWTPSISDSVRQFVSSTAQHLVIGGPVTYEIDYLYPLAATSGPPAEFRLELVLPGTLSYHGRQPIQYIPAAFGGPQDNTGLNYVHLNPATLVTFRLDPAEESAVRKMVSFLRAASSLQGAEMSLMEQSARGGTPYSFTEHQRERAELFAKVTEPVGWNVRGLFQDNLLAPYEVWRQLRFLEFKVRLRDLLMDRLNTTLSEVGSQMGFQAAIELSGLPSLQDVDDAKDDLRNGRRSLNDLATFAI
jgi:hypothetical protein